ncbi:MAG: hypothetical protein KME50_32075 [Nostoc desertorum CM1-VF14]|nr:hypothetical protein [Nostoc desertorum CM1-VF14]
MGEYPEQLWQFGIQWLWVAVSMEISPQRDSKEVKLYEGCGKTFRNWCPVLRQL